MRIAALPAERWARKPVEWNPGLSTNYKTYRAVGRPKKDGKTKSMNFSEQKESKRKRTMMREITMRGSRQRKIRKVGRKWKAVLQAQTTCGEETATFFRVLPICTFARFRNPRIP